MKNFTLALWGFLLYFGAYAQSDIVLEPVGRYIYQASNHNFDGTDHLLGANGLSNSRILINSVGLAIVNTETMSISGSTDYTIRAERGGG